MKSSTVASTEPSSALSIVTPFGPEWTDISWRIYASTTFVGCRRRDTKSLRDTFSGAIMEVSSPEFRGLEVRGCGAPAAPSGDLSADPPGLSIAPFDHFRIEEHPEPVEHPSADLRHQPPHVRGRRRAPVDDEVGVALRDLGVALAEALAAGHVHEAPRDRARGVLPDAA